MKKINSTRRNKLITVPKNLYKGEGTEPNFLQKAITAAGGPIGIASVASSAVGGLVGNATSGGLSSGAGNAINKVGNALGSIPILGGFAKGALNIVGGGVNALFGMKANQEEINRVNKGISAFNESMSAASNATSFDDNALLGPTAMNFNVNAYKGGAFKKGAARRKNAALQAELRDAYNYADRTTGNTIGNIADTQIDNAMAAFHAYGGPIGAIDYDLANQFLDAKMTKAIGQDKTLTALPNSFEGLDTFAFGGELNTQGADFTNGLLYINNGGSHESNPYEGIPMGIAPDGTPNLVEEGETIFNDYVFSRRMKVPKSIRNKYKLGGNLNFAEASKKLAKESEERPNDPISQRGLEAMMADLATAQEELRQKKQAGQEGTQYGGGGDLTIDDVNNSSVATVVKLLDPTGISSWYDVYSAGKDMYKNPSWANAGGLALETFGAIPLVGKVGKTIKGAMKLGTKLYAKKAAKKYGLDVAERLQKDLIDQAIIRSPGFSKDTYDMVKHERQKANKKAHGGRMDTLFDGFGPAIPSYVEDPYVNKAGVPKFGTGVTPSGEWVEEPKYMARAAAKRAGYYVDSSLDDYNKNPIKAPEKKKNAVSRLLSNLDATDLRYAPVLGAAIGLGTDLFSKPDYSTSDAILEAANSAGNFDRVTYNPIGNYLTYRPLDRNYYSNQLRSSSGAAMRNIMNTSGGNRGAAMAGLIAANYNAGIQQGNLARQAEEYNLAQRQQVEQFNRGTNQMNSEMGLKAAMANQEAALKSRSSRLSGIAQAMAMRDAIDARRGASMSANLTNLFDSLGNIGIDEMNRADRDMLIRAGVFGTLSEKPQGWSNKRWEDYKKAISGNGYSKGGKLKKRRGGLIY